MLSVLKSYTHWLHGSWPVPNVEPLPVVDVNGRSSVDGAYIVGDLTGIPLLKFAADTGAKAVKNIVSSSAFQSRNLQENVHDVIIIGGGVSGYSAALEAKKQGLSFILVEANEAFSTITNFPKQKPIFTYPNEMEPEGEIHFGEDVKSKETLLASLKQQIKNADIDPLFRNVTEIKKTKSFIEVVSKEVEPLKAHRVIIAIGRSGNYRKLNVPGEEKALNRLHDPKVYSDKDVLVVGGGDSALETAIAISEAGGKVTLSYRKSELTRAKPENIQRLEKAHSENQLALRLGTQLKSIEDTQVTLLSKEGKEEILQNDAVFSMIGREAPLDFFRRSKIDIAGESRPIGWVMFIAFMLFAIALYDWKNWGFLNSIWSLTDWPNNMPSIIASWGSWWQLQVEDRTTLIGTIATSMKGRSFYYTLAYTSVIGIFGYLRIRRRKTPYITIQTWTLFLVQLIPLFLLPEVILPWIGYLGAYDAGAGKAIADSLFPSYISAEALAAREWPEWGHPRAYWHAYGFILAWPLNVYNVFTPTPIVGWLIISAIQTFVIIPLLIYKFGKGAYCGWICSCGALAETLGDTQRHKMLKGRFWNKFNMLGQFILLVAFVMLFARIVGWVWPETWVGANFDLLLKGENSDYKLVNPVSWKWMVDVLLGGILGVGLYFKFSGRTWCRFACPLAALMHIYSRFSRFRIFADKDKCISCNQCSSVCHQGIDIMNFANKGQAMQDPQCVRCSACVHVCPTGTLSFGELKSGVQTFDSLPASPVQMSQIIAKEKA